LNISFCPLYSGSSGNSVFFKTPGASVLIDAGLSGVRIERALASIGENPADISAIFLTHEHSDHISGAGILSRRFGIDIFATEGTWEYIERGRLLGRLDKSKKRVIAAGAAFDYRDFTASPFGISHDALNPVGYNFFCRGKKITVATDLGHVSPAVEFGIRDSHILLIEANHDVDMLRMGRYPLHLKRRILSDIGHLSNVACGRALGSLAEGLGHIYLGHMSEENNNPILAFETVKGIIEESGTGVNGENGGVRLYLAERHRAARRISLGL
jgi:phosphoribosyl 1,2-cyclic phosphodiesterase